MAKDRIHELFQKVTVTRDTVLETMERQNFLSQIPGMRKANYVVYEIRPQRCFKTVMHVDTGFSVGPKRDWKDPPKVLRAIICRGWVLFCFL